MSKMTLLGWRVKGSKARCSDYLQCNKDSQCNSLVQLDLSNSVNGGQAARRL